MNQNLQNWKRIYEAQGVILNIMAQEFHYDDWEPGYKILNRILARLDIRAKELEKLI